MTTKKYTPVDGKVWEMYPDEVVSTMEGGRWPYGDDSYDWPVGVILHRHYSESRVEVWSRWSPAGWVHITPDQIELPDFWNTFPQSSS